MTRLALPDQRNIGLAAQQSGGIGCRSTDRSTENLAYQLLLLEPVAPEQVNEPWLTRTMLATVPHVNEYEPGITKGAAQSTKRPGFLMKR